MKKSTRHQKRSARQQGVALLEALIGILIFAFGILGLVGLQASMTQSQTSSKFRADAANLVSDLFGLIQTDHLSNMGRYQEFDSVAACSGYTRCAEWKAKVARVLPSGAVRVKVNTIDGTVSAEVSWKQGGGQTNKFTSSMNWQQ